MEFRLSNIFVLTSENGSRVYPKLFLSKEQAEEYNKSLFYGKGIIISAFIDEK